MLVLEHRTVRFRPNIIWITWLTHICCGSIGRGQTKSIVSDEFLNIGKYWGLYCIASRISPICNSSRQRTLDILNSLKITHVELSLNKRWIETIASLWPWCWGTIRLYVNFRVVAGIETVALLYVCSADLVITLQCVFYIFGTIRITAAIVIAKTWSEVTMAGADDVVGSCTVSIVSLATDSIQHNNEPTKFKHSKYQNTYKSRYHNQLLWCQHFMLS